MIDSNTRRKVLTRDKNKCHYCKNKATQVDHKIPQSIGGEDTEDNLVASCQPCNVAKGTLSYYEFRFNGVRFIKPKAKHRKHIDYKAIYKYLKAH